MKRTLKLAVLSASLLLFLFLPDPVWADHGVAVKNQSSVPVTYEVTWVSDSWSEPDIPAEECALRPGEHKVHAQAGNNYSLQITYYKKRRKQTWCLDTYEGEDFKATKGYVFTDCGRSFCFNQEQ